MKLDPQSEKILSLIFPSVAERWRLCQKDMLSLHNIPIRLTQGLRTLQEQMTLWSQGRAMIQGHWQITQPKKLVTHAYPGQSLHNFGLALDICVASPNPYPHDPELWENYGSILKTHGLTWGGDWTGADCDRPHCEDKFGFTLQEIQAFYNKNRSLKDVWDACETRLMPGQPR